MLTNTLRRLFLAGCLACAAVPSQAQNEQIQRLLLERQQQQQEQALKQQQHAESLDPHRSPAQKQKLEMLQQDQRLRQHELHQRQTQQFLELEQTPKNEPSAQNKLPPELRLQQYQREQMQQMQEFEQERRNAEQNVSP